MAYESPISMTIGDMITDLREKQDQLILDACQRVGVKVDKEELQRALTYDRGQYERGYADGYDTGLIDGMRAIRNAVEAEIQKAGGLEP